MSAPAFAIPAAPFMGNAAASKRSATTNDADFAAIMDEGAPAEAPARPAAPVTSKGATETAPAPVEDAAPEAVEAAPAVDGTVVTMPAPLIALAPPIVVETEVVVAETIPAAPAAGAPPAPSDDLAALAEAPVAAEPAVAGPASADEKAPASGTAAPSTTQAQAPAPALVEAKAPAETKAPADLPDLAALLPKQPKAATISPAAQPPAAALAAAVAPLAPRPAKPVVEATATVEAADQAPVTAEAATLEAPAAPAEAPRTRDVIDRAVPHRADGQVVSSANANADAEAAPSSDGAEPTPAAPAPQMTAARPAAVTEAVVLTTPLADDAVVAAPLATTAQLVEARAADPAVSLALSTVSHASIETTAQIAAQIVKKLEGRSVRFEMALTPEGLGNVDVSLDIDADGKLIAKMAFDNPLAATELRGRADELRRQLQDSGFTVADDALSFAERDASAGQHGGSAFDNRPDPRGAGAFGAGARLSAEADIAVPGRWIPLTLTPDRVDMKV